MCPRVVSCRLGGRAQDETAAESPRPALAVSIVAPLEHSRRRVDADSLARHPRHRERDAPPVRGRPAGVSCPVRQDYVTLAPASLAVGLGAMVADQGLSVGSRQPASLLAGDVGAIARSSVSPPPRDARSQGACRFATWTVKNFFEQY